MKRARAFDFSILAVFLGQLAGLLASCAPLEAAEQASKGKVLVLVSSSSVLSLKDGVKHPTGFFLNELGVPLKALVDAGYEPVFMDPLGNEPSMDTVSDKPRFFGHDLKEYDAIKSFVEKLPGLNHPKKISELAATDLSQYAGLFAPGGHAPMEDLWKQPALGKILRYFHEHKKPTALICHGPIALLAAAEHPESIVAQVEKSPAKAKSVGKWTYAGYRMTVFSNAEEKPNEGKGALGGYMFFYPEDALRAAGAELKIAPPGQGHVEVDRELITGQNPNSDKELAEKFLQALNSQKSAR